MHLGAMACRVKCRIGTAAMILEQNWEIATKIECNSLRFGPDFRKINSAGITVGKGRTVPDPSGRDESPAVPGQSDVGIILNMTVMFYSLNR